MMWPPRLRDFTESDIDMHRPRVVDAVHAIIHRDPFAYCAHPHLAALDEGRWLVVFNRTVRRSFRLHPPEDPLYRNLVMRTEDAGLSWTSPEVVPGYDRSGMECASLTPLADGRVMLNQWRFRWYPLGLARRMSDRVRLKFPRALADELASWAELDSGPALRRDPEALMPWARGDGEASAHFSDDGGRSWTETVQLDTRPFVGGFAMRGAKRLSNGEIVLPMTDIPNWRTAFVITSRDGGRTWSAPSLAAATEGHAFGEVDVLPLGGDRLLMMLRDETTHRLYRCQSADCGRSWTPPTDTGIEGYPPHLLRLPDGAIICTFGHRRPDYGIRAVLSYDDGQTWDVANTLVIRGELRNNDLGYACTTIDSESLLFTVYYAQDEDEITCIQATRWSIG